MKKGFTLIELLAVIVIIAVIALITVPLVFESIDAAKTRVYVLNENTLASSANLYMVSDDLLIPTNDGEIKVVTLDDLIAAKMISPIIDSNTNLECDGYVVIKKEGEKIIKMPYLKCGTNYETEGYSFGTLTNVEVLVVAGGGGGASSVASSGGGGGGGAGGLTYNASYALGGTGNFNVTVGSGGAAGGTNLNQNGVNGTNSVFATMTTIGGGAGGRPASNGFSGGSGGGGGYNGYTTVRTGGAATAGQGRNGGSTSQLSWAGGAGGGGAGGLGGDNLASHTGGVGGAGLYYTISGASVYYANGGRGGGGAGPVDSPLNTGKGGDGAYSTAVARAGSDGIVIIRYPGHQKANGGTITYVGGNTIHTFTNVGSSTFEVPEF